MSITTVNMVVVFCFGIFVISQILLLQVLVDCMGNAYSAVKNIGRRLQEELRTTRDEQARLDIEYLISKVNNIQPATAAGYFTIDRSCLMGMLSIR